jgi:hypothetical protein
MTLRRGKRLPGLSAPPRWKAAIGADRVLPVEQVHANGLDLVHGSAEVTSVEDHD